MEEEEDLGHRYSHYLYHPVVYEEALIRAQNKTFYPKRKWPCCVRYSLILKV